VTASTVWSITPGDGQATVNSFPAFSGTWSITPGSGEATVTSSPAGVNTQFIVVPAADVTAGSVTTFANAVLRSSAELSGLTDGTDYIAIVTNLSDPFEPASANPAPLFSSGQQGAWLEAFDIATLFQAANGTNPVTTAGNPVGRMSDKSGRGNHFIQTNDPRRGEYQTGPARVVMTNTDEFVLDVPTGGFTGTMVLGTPIGTASYGVTIPAGLFTIGKRVTDYFPGTSLVGMLIRDGALSVAEAAAVAAYFVDNGAVASYGAVTSVLEFWRNWTFVTSFPAIDTSSVINFRLGWNGCLFTSFPLLDTSSGEDFTGTWANCTNLADFPANFFDDIKGGNLTNAFMNTALTQTSIDNILVSLVASGIEAGTRVFLQSGGTAPSVGTGRPAIDTLRSRGWTVTTTGGY